MSRVIGREGKYLNKCNGQCNGCRLWAETNLADNISMAWHAWHDIPERRTEKPAEILVGACLPLNPKNKSAERGVGNLIVSGDDDRIVSGERTYFSIKPMTVHSEGRAGVHPAAGIKQHGEVEAASQKLSGSTCMCGSMLSRSGSTSPIPSKHTTTAPKKMMYVSGL